MSTHTETAAPAAERGWIAKRYGALRAFAFPLSVLPVVIAAALVKPFAEWDWPILIASVVGVILLHATGNLLNDVFDLRSGVDRRTEDDEDRPGRFLVHGQLSQRDVVLEALVCLLAAAGVGAYLLWRCGPEVLYFAGGGVVGLYIYTGPPLPMKYKAMGEVVIFVVFGPLLLMGAAFVQTGVLWSWPVFYVSIPVGIATSMVLFGNNIRDLGEDSDAGITTLASLLGKAGSRVLFVLGVLAPPLTVAAFVIIGNAGLRPWALACLISLLPVAFLLKKFLTSPRLPDIDARVAQCAAVFMVTLLAGVMLQGAA